MSISSGLLPTIVQSALGATVGVIVGQSVGLLYKRFLRRENERIEQLVKIIEDVIGVTINIPKVQKGSIMNFAQYRKAFAAGFGVLFLGLLTWASTSTELKTMLEQVVPPAFVPLVGVLLGGIATVVAVIRAKNETAPAETPTTVAVTAPAAQVATTTAPTSVVQLLTAPSASYL